MKIISSMLVAAEKMLLLLQIDFDDNCHNFPGFYFTRLLLQIFVLGHLLPEKRIVQVPSIYKSIEQEIPISRFQGLIVKSFPRQKIHQQMIRKRFLT
jgi:hypothetical protein